MTSQGALHLGLAASLAANVALVSACEGASGAPGPYEVVPAWPALEPGLATGQVSGVALDLEERLWIFRRAEVPWSGQTVLSPIAAPTLLRLDRATGSITARWGAGEHFVPHGLSIDARGHLWLTDVGRHVVVELDADGAVVRTLGTVGRAGDDTTHFDMPTDVFVDADGSVFVADGYGNARIVVFDRDDAFVRTWGEPGGAPGQLDTPHAIAGDARGLYVADRGNAVQGGGLRCWGFNGYGQLGNGTGVDSSIPLLVPGLESGVTSVSVGLFHTCAIHQGAAKCWGYNYSGQVGDGSTVDRATPVAVLGLGAGSGLTALHAGYTRTFAIVAAGAKCWGYNGDGQLGDGTLVNRAVPTQVVGLTAGVTKLSLNPGVFLMGASSHTCVIVDGGAKCWGANWSGELGDGTRVGRTTPVAVQGMATDVEEIAAGGNHTCAIARGAVRCWGYARNGQLGDGGRVDSPSRGRSSASRGSRARTAPARRTPRVSPGFARSRAKPGARTATGRPRPAARSRC